MNLFETNTLPPLIDVNVHLSRWPFRRLPGDTPDRLVSKLKAQGVKQAWTSSFDVLLHLDVQSANERLVEECREYGQGLLVPFGGVNLTLPYWQDDVEYCAAEASVQGVRVYPSWHDYSLEDQRLYELCQLCQEKNLLLQMVVRLEDARTEHPRGITKQLDWNLASALIEKFPALPIVLLNAGRDINPSLAGKLAGLGQVYLDLGFVEQTGGMSRYLKTVPPERLLFGSYFPFFYLESGVLKLQEAALGHYLTEKIAWKNASELLRTKN